MSASLGFEKWWKEIGFRQAMMGSLAAVPAKNLAELAWREAKADEWRRMAADVVPSAGAAQYAKTWCPECTPDNCLGCGGIYVHSQCGCPACRDGTAHASDCAVHNEPAYPNGPCDCGALGNVPSREHGPEEET